MKIARRVTEIQESATLAVSAKAEQLKQAGVDVISFGAGEPDFDTPDPIKQAAKDALDAGYTKYPKPSSGLQETKSAIRGKFERENGLRYATAQILVTAGCKMACYLAIQATIDPGDEVIIPVPYWVSYPELVRLAGGSPVMVRGEGGRGFGFPADAVAASVTAKTRAIILNSPNNPGGFVYSEAELRAAAQIARRHDLMVLSDETYDRLLFGQHRHVSFASLDDDAYQRTITVNSASKTYAMPGWRVGFAAGPKAAIGAMAKLESQTASGVATFTQMALTHALNADQATVEHMRAEFERRGRYMAGRLNAMPGVQCAEPGGAFYCFPRVAETYGRLGVIHSGQFAEKLLLDAKVAVVPGAAFGADDHVRFSFATGMNQIEKGLDRLEAWLREHR